MMIVDTSPDTSGYPCVTVSATATETITCGESYCYNLLDHEDLFFEVETIPGLRKFGRRLRCQKPVKRNYINRRMMFCISGRVSKRISKIRRSR